MLPEVPDRLQDCLQPPGEHVAGIGPVGPAPASVVLLVIMQAPRWSSFGNSSTPI